MPIKLRSVRAKLTALVALSVVVMVATIPILSWLLHNQLIEEVDDRVEEAKKAFETELDDDVSDLTLTVRVMMSDDDAQRALKEKDAATARKMAQVFASLYPELDIVFGDADGNVLTQLGVTAPPDRVDSIQELAGMTSGSDFHGMIEHGCEKPGSNGAPAMVVASGVKGLGSIVVCQPIDRKFLDNAGSKLQLELALLDPTGAHVDSTKKWPDEHIAPPVGNDAIMVEASKTSWAVATFEPDGMTGVKGKYRISAALDVGDVRAIVKQHLFFALGCIAFAAIVSVLFGWRLASIMSNALQRMTSALKKLEEQQYVHVTGVNTGDELQDLAVGFNTMVDGLKERDKLRATMGKYMTAAVMERAMAGDIVLGGETLTVTILFSDIRSFTTLSEKMDDPQALVKLLNEYFTEMVGIVMEHDGVVDKYIGDAIMAVFGAPVPKETDALNAVKAAVRMRQALRRLNERLAERGVDPIKTGIGLHTGSVVAGNIGSDRRMEYTVIGDAVNLASRLESSTKELHVNVLISEDTNNLVKDHVQTRAVKEILVKGKTKPVMTFEVLGMNGEDALESCKERASSPQA
jgi:adenylate cyclase